MKTSLSLSPYIFPLYTAHILLSIELVPTVCVEVEYPGRGRGCLALGGGWSLARQSLIPSPLLLLGLDQLMLQNGQVCLT